MEIIHHGTISLTDPSDASEARRRALELAVSLGFPKADASNVAIIVTEAAKNVVRHASRGELILQALKCKEAVGIEALALNGGPGMSNVARCLADGYSSAGSPGTGMGAMQRLSSVFDVHSTPESGAVVFIRYWSNPHSECVASHGFDVGAVCMPKPGETECGDGWAMADTGNRVVTLVVDGLGHGPLAAAAAGRAVRTFRGNSQLSPCEILSAIHESLRGTRGAAAGVTEVDLAARVVRFAGVGNVAAAVLSREGIKRMVSHNGIVGGEVRKIQEFEYAWPDYAVLVVHSDGMSGRWTPDRYPGLLHRAPGVIAGVLYRDHRRGNDDVVVVVARSKHRSGSADSGKPGPATNETA